MINDASVVIGGGNWGIKEADVLGYKLINSEYYARDIDFANSTAAGTYTDSTGVVRKAPYNLLQYSEQFDNVAWGKLGSPAPVVTANDTISPSGLQDADSLVMLSPSVATRLNQSVSFVNSTYVFSVYVKSLSGTNNTIRLVKFDGTSETFSSDITVTTEWTRVSYTFIAVFGSGNINIRAGASTSNVNIAIWGAQLVEGTEALPYFPTTTRLNVPRIDYRNADGSLSTTGRLLLELQRTNSIRNSSMVGAVAGTPGTLPTNYTSNFRGFSSQVVGTGTENGVPYFDLRLFGTSTGGQVEITLEGNQQMAALVGQTWSLSSYLRIIAGSLPSGSQAGFAITERNSAGASLVEQAYPLTVTSSLQRFTATRTLNQATTAFVNVRVIVTTSLTPADFTIRIAAPQMELGAYATSYIPTTTAAVTRNADVASRTGVESWIGQTEGTLYCEFNIGSDTFDGDLISVNGGSSANGFFVSFRNSKVVQLIVRTSGTNALIFQRTGAYPIGTNKIAVAYKNGDFAISLNGTAAQVNTSTVTMPTGISVVELSVARLYTSPMPIAQAQAIIFPTRLTNSQLQSLTTL